MTIDTIWYTRCPVPTPLGLAAKLGWFDGEFAPDGIAIKSLREVGDPSQHESHYDHTLEHSFRQGGSVPAIWARSLGRNTRVIGLNWLDEFQGIVALPQSGIKTAADLRGKRLGLPVHENSIDFGRAGALRGLTAGLSLGGVAENEASFIDVVVTRRAVDPAIGKLGFPFTLRGGGGYGEQFHALIRGHVDAIYVKGAGGAQLAHQLGAIVVADIATHPDPLARSNNGVPRPITVDQGLIDARPDLVRRFLARIIDIGDWARANPDETTAYVARESAAPEAWVKHAYKDVASSLDTTLDDIAVAALGSFKDFLFQRGFLESDFDIRAWVDPQPLTDELAARASRVARAVNQ
jgi:ABC-type nitrate/sulfonate/bicarbonate transport system substrate-binding protein